MADVTCSRCGNTTAGLAAQPFTGSIGAAIRDQVCAACWRDWMAMQVKVINEYRLSPLDPKHFELLMAQLKTFLNMKME